MSLVTVAIDGALATLTINRPEALNALNSALLHELHNAVDSVKDKARAIIVTGAGKAFVAGADIQEMVDLEAKEAQAFSEAGQSTFRALAEFPGPVIAAVNGYALGGGLELAMACDIILASDRAVVGQPEVQLGVVPGFGGSQRLARRVGPGRAKWLLMTGEKVKADEALRLGIVDRVVPGEQLMAEARTLAEACLQNGPLAVASVKELVSEGLDEPLGKALSLEAKAFGRSFATKDQEEGMRAFLEKRKANFRGT